MEQEQEYLAALQTAASDIEVEPFRLRFDRLDAGGGRQMSEFTYQAQCARRKLERWPA